MNEDPSEDSEALAPPEIAHHSYLLEHSYAKVRNRKKRSIMFLSYFHFLHYFLPGIVSSRAVRSAVQRNAGTDGYLGNLAARKLCRERDDHRVVYT